PAYLRLARAFRAFQPDIVYERYNLFYVAGALLARRWRVPFYVEVNAPLADERGREGGLGLAGVARAMERFVWNRAARIAAVTGVLRDTIAAQGAPRARIEVVANGIDMASFAAIPAASGHGETVTVGFVGFMRAWHGLDRLLQEAARHGDARVQLLIVGDGPALAGLRRQAETLGLGRRVRFTGLARRDAVPGLLAEMDIVIQPKAVAYASPLKIFEYMAAGRAIVAPDQPNIREVLAHEETALLFNPAEPDATWRAVLRLVEDAPLRHRLGVAARAEIARRDYTWRANAERIADWARADLAPSAALVTAALEPASPRP
ncbi:MAG: glycosyltransferase family 4 protein, partial [Acetobacteraceae bacterium]|nr:glycosyltransferase family 4 protein [Acetobacteraceae bacterium]